MKTKVDSIAETRKRLSDCGLRTTAARLAVIHWLQRAGSPATHAEIAADLVPLGFDKATVFRNLTDLVEAGLVTRKELGDRELSQRNDFGEPRAGEEQFWVLDPCQLERTSQVDRIFPRLEDRLGGPRPLRGWGCLGYVRGRLRGERSHSEHE